MSRLNEMYEKMEAERVKRNAEEAKALAARRQKEQEFLRNSKLHLADVRTMTDRDFRYMEVLETAFAGVRELVRPERWRQAPSSVSAESVILSTDRYGEDCLTLPAVGWFKCLPASEEVPELVSCSMPTMDFSGYFTGLQGLSAREKRNFANLVVEPGNEQLQRVMRDLSGSQEYVTVSYPLGDEDGNTGELVFFRDGHVFDSVPYQWFRAFRLEHFAPDSVDTDRLAVNLALDINLQVQE